MIRVLKLTFIASTFLVFSSCKGPNGPDGKDGSAFLSVASNDGRLYAYIDNDTTRVGASGGVFYLAHAYKVSPGTYLFAYESRYYYAPPSYYYVQWSGTYSIWVNEGGKGGDGKLFWQKGDAGKDGANNTLTLYCNYTGYFESRTKMLAATPPPITEPEQTVQYVNGDYGITVTYRLTKTGRGTEEHTLELDGLKVKGEWQ